jgi:hypothetical protein
MFGPNLAAIEQLRREMLPADWKWVLVRGKAAFGAGTSKDPLSPQEALSKWEELTHRTGIGVVTGDASNGLIAVDIDGPLAEEAFKTLLGEQWPGVEEPGTMSWRGRPGRRQLVYKVPDSLRGLLTSFTKAQMVQELKGTDEEVCVRYNGCYSVIPGSEHPDTKQPYEWISYNEGKVAPAPGWLVNFLMNQAEPKEVHSFLPASYLEKSDAATEFTNRQMRRHFFMEGGLLEKLTEHESAFDQIFYSEVWEEGFQPLTPEGGNSDVLVGGCPFHDSNSGKSFALWPNLNWYCHKEETGGDALQLLHALRTRDIHAGDPAGATLEGYLIEIAGAVGVKYPEDFRDVQKVQEVKKYDPIGGPSFLVAANNIIELFRNPAEQRLELMQLAHDYGVRMTPDEILLALQEDVDFKTSGTPVGPEERRKLIKGSDYLIPDLLKRPNTVLFHGDGGCGKSLACQVIAKHVGRGLPFKIRGEQVPVREGLVLWCNADQSPEILEEQFEDQGIHRDSWLRVWNGFRMSYRKRLVDELNRYQPALVIIDSLSASQPTIDGNKQIASSGLYWLENNNGLLWPATCFLIIHHNNKQGGFRGHSSIRDAVSETWSIRKLDDNEVQSDEYGAESFRKRVITIGKSRNGREGDKLVTTLNEDFTMDLEDYTPVRRVRQGGSVPVIDKVLGQLREDTAQGVLRTRKELEALLMRPTGDRSVEKSLARLKKRGLIEAFDAEHQHRAQGRPEKVYAAITASLNTGAGVQQSAAGLEPSRGDINESVSGLKEPAPPQGSSNPTPNPTTDPVGFEKVHSATESHPSSDEVEEVHPSQTRHPAPVGFEEPSDCKGFAKPDNFGERVEEAPFEGDLDLSAYDLEGEPPSWDELI